ncbi:MAG: hypothetical protein R3E32_11360 [Chitinophagales bacterium]
MKEIQHPMKANKTTPNRQWWLKEINLLTLKHLSDSNLKEKLGR